LFKESGCLVRRENGELLALDYGIPWGGSILKYSFGIIAKALILFFVLICATTIQAQSGGQPPNQPANQPEQSSPSAAPAQQQPPSTSGQQPTEPGQTTQATSKDRLFYTLPNFLTLENAGQVPPLTAKEKFKIVARSSFDYVEFPWYAALAGISQAEDSEKGYGQGAQGYGKRYGAAFADGTIENFFTSAIFPSILHQDPRFFQSGKGGFWHRTGYAMSRIFIIRGDSGNNQFNFSEIVGSAVSSGISTYSYHPHADQTLSNTASVWGTQIGYDTITLVVKEFWPDIRRKIHKDRTQQQP
jgi:hypothetical protein